ncbi:hypothetical protein D3C72_2309200 [compost metagenome]
MFTASERAIRKAPGTYSSAAVNTSMPMDEPKPATRTSANILLGMEVSVSSSRLRKASTHDPVAAASSASTVPVLLAIKVATRATPTV